MRYLPLLLVLITFSASAETVYQGKVVKIADGKIQSLALVYNSATVRERKTTEGATVYSTSA